jgi:hypothetical protein
MSCIYTGFRTHNTKNGIFKIGQTKEKYPTGRLNSNSLECIYYMSLPKTSVAQLDLLEACARLACEEMGMPHLYSDTKDWFAYSVDNRFASNAAQAERFAKTVMIALIQECDRRGWEYEVRACFKNGRRYSCAAAKVYNFI